VSATEASRLSDASIAAQLKTLLKRGPARPIALHGSGPGGPLEVDGVRWQVRPVRSELELRAALVDATPTSALALLVDFTDRLPLDLACRLAGQRVHVVDKRARLAELFGARKIAPGFARTKLATALLEELPETLEPIRGTLLQPDDAWQRYLALHLPLLPAERMTLASLLHAALRDPEVGAAFARRREDATWKALLDDAAAFFRRTLSPAGEALWRAWAAGTVERSAAWLVLVDAARRADHGGASAVLKAALRYAPGVDAALLLEPTVAMPLCEALEGFLDGANAADRRRILQPAATLLEDADFAPARRASPWLPEGLVALEDALAAALPTAPKNPDALNHAIHLLTQIQEHRLADAEGAGMRRHTVRMAGVRLVTWMAWQERRPLPDDLGWVGLARLARWYDTEGGWVDWARDTLRNHTTDHEGLDLALRPLLEQTDRLRRDLDRRFAEATLAWYEAGKPSTEVLGIEDISKKVIADFLDAQPTRRLLVIVLDGMSVPVATRILCGLADWSPVAWAPHRAAGMPPAIAALPTLTKTSRAALFAGKSLPRFGTEPESKDPNRWAGNPALAAFAGTDQGPRLFLKGSLTQRGDLHPELQQVLQNEQERVVAVVVNAVDDQLDGSDQVAVDYERPQAIPLLSRLLRVARDSRRAVLLTSDHGHVPAQVLQRQSLPEGSTPGGKRWRVLGPGQAPQEGEIALPERCWRPRGNPQVALAWDERRCWGASSSGAHGGLSMAEAIVPLRLLAPDWLYNDGGLIDEGLQARDLDMPAWWRLAPPTRRAPTTPTAQTSLLQLPLLSGGATPTPSKPPPPVVFALAEDRHRLTRALAASELFRAQSMGQAKATVDRALDFVDALTRAPNQLLSLDAFARAVGTSARRIAGRIAQTGFLNADGFTILELDQAGRQVRLHLERLITQYGLEVEDEA